MAQIIAIFLEKLVVSVRAAIVVSRPGRQKEPSECPQANTATVNMAVLMLYEHDWLHRL